MCKKLEMPNLRQDGFAISYLKFKEIVSGNKPLPLCQILSYFYF